MRVPTIVDLVGLSLVMAFTHYAYETLRFHLLTVIVLWFILIFAWGYIVSGPYERWKDKED